MAIISMAITYYFNDNNSGIDYRGQEVKEHLFAKINNKISYLCT